MEKSNHIPYFSVIKNHKKAKGRENYKRESKDHASI